MKKILAVLLAVMMLVSMTACGSSEKAAETTAAAAAETTAAAAAETEAAAAEVYNVGICQLVTHDALDAATQGFQDALVDALLEGPEAFRGTDPIDAYCGLWDTHM